MNRGILAKNAIAAARVHSPTRGRASLGESHAAALPAERAHQLRRQIAEETYLTADKLEVAVDRLYEALRAGGEDLARRRTAG